MHRAGLVPHGLLEGSAILLYRTRARDRLVEAFLDAIPLTQCICHTVEKSRYRTWDRNWCSETYENWMGFVNDFLPCEQIAASHVQVIKIETAQPVKIAPLS